MAEIGFRFQGEPAGRRKRGRAGQRAVEKQWQPGSAGRAARAGVCRAAGARAARYRSRAGAGGARQSASGPRPRGRVAGVRRAAVCPRAPGGGGEPRAARPSRPRAHAASARPTSAPARSASRPRKSRHRARSLPLRAPRPPPAPSRPALRPLFLWAHQSDGTVREVRCEDYDPRNRIRIARTPDGWRVIPRTEIYDSIRVPPAPPRARERRERRRRRASERRRARAQAAWCASAPDLESHIPSHTIAVPRAPSRAPSRSPSPCSPCSPCQPCSPCPPPAPATPAEPTPLDNLLAVAELEFNQQRGTDLLELEPAAPQFTFLPPEEEVAGEAMSFELGEPKPDEMFFNRKAHAPPERPEEDYQSDMAVHKDLFETISEAHYLPELGGPHDEALLESLVEKGCEDNQILGQALDKFAHLVHGTGDYAEEEDDMMLGGAPVADIIDRLEQSLESPSRSSITAAQGLLHLHHIGDHLAPAEQQQSADREYLSDEVFVPSSQAECTMQTVNSQDTHNVNHIDYDSSAEKRLENCVEAEDVMYTEPVPDTHETYEDKTFESQQFHEQTSFDKNQRFEEHPPQLLPDQSEEAMHSDTTVANETSEEISDIKCESENLMDTIKDEEPVVPVETVDFKELEDEAVELVATDLRIKHVDKSATPIIVASVAETTNVSEDNLSEKSDEQPRDLSVPRRLPTPHASPRRMDLPRAPSRESDAMQSPQPSGIPAVPSSPEIFTMPPTKSKQTLFLETLLSSPSPKMYTSEVTITKQQAEPLNLGKHRKSASPTITSYSDEIKKLNKEFGEPQEKRKRESTEDLVKISKVFNKCSDDHVTESKKKSERPTLKSCEEGSPLRQLQMLKTSLDFNIPDPLLVPRDKMNDIVAAPGKEIPALLAQRPELRLPEAFAFPTVLQDPNILVISLSQLENILMNDEKTTETHKPVSTKTSSHGGHGTPQADQPSQSQPKPIPSMDALAGDIDAATSAALNQMLWLPYLSQLEAMAACSQNMDFLKALNSSGYTGANYPDLSQMFNPSSRLMGPSGFPMMPPMDYDNRLQFAMWQEAMNHANSTSSSQRPKPSSLETQMKELSSKSSDVQNPFVHSTKSHQSKSHSSARTSPIAHNYNSNHNHNHNHSQRMNQNPFLQGMYPGMSPNMRPNVPLPGLQIPYFNPNMMSQRSPRTSQQKSPTSPYYQNNNYLQSVKQSESQSHQRSSSSSSQESPRPRISVKSLQNLLEPTAAASGMRRPSAGSSALGRRREEPEVGSTTPGEPPLHLPPHPHDPSSFHLWHPLFGNQKGYASPWSWTTVTATGD